MNELTTAQVIMLGSRFFYKIEKGRVYTSWSLAGAAFFLPNSHLCSNDINEYLEKLKELKKEPIVKNVKIEI